MINIPSYVQDPSYRYKMPKMHLVTESRGNGIKTNVFNVEDVARHLRIPSLSIMKYFCDQLGANMEKDSIIKGQHTYDVLLKHLDKFIERYVLCKNCKYPEIQHRVEGKDDLQSKCSACSSNSSHDGKSKAGKAIVNWLKSGGAQLNEFGGEDRRKEEVIKPKAEKKREEVVSDADDEISIDSRRIGKYKVIPKLFVIKYILLF